MIEYYIYSIPNEVRGLEYLNLLYKNVQGQFGDNNFLVKTFFWAKALCICNSKNVKNIIHIHWETNIYGSRFFLVSIFRMLYRFPILFLLKFSGVKIVWTIHNLSAHDYKHLYLDKFGKEIMWKLASRVIIQEKRIADLETVKRNTKKIIWIPQGNYVGVYGPLLNISKNDLRKKYKLPEDKILLLALGSVRPYKALPKLIEQLDSVVSKGADVHLLIAGKTSGDYKKVIEKKVFSKPFVTFIPEFVPDEKIPEFLCMADYTIYYYADSSLSSAAMMMSLSYGVPVIIRDIPASEIIQNGVNGFVYKTDEELINLIKNLSNIPLLDKQKVINTIINQSWERVAKELRQLYIGVNTNE